MLKYDFFVCFQLDMSGGEEELIEMSGSAFVFEHVIQCISSHYL